MIRLALVDFHRVDPVIPRWWNSKTGCRPRAWQVEVCGGETETDVRDS